MTDSTRSHAWVEHLRAGGTTPWADFRGEAASTPTRTWIPGAAQLELARRVNLAAAARDDGPGRREHTRLVDTILSASAPGRGLPDLPVLGAAPDQAWGPRPVDPADVPARQLVRVGIGAVAELVAAIDPGPAPEEPQVAGPRLFLGRRGFRLTGSPLAADELRTVLAAAGRRPGGPWPKTVVLLGNELGAMLADTWARRVRAGASGAWPGFVRSWEQRDALPPRVDLPRLAARWADRVGVRNVHVVLQEHPAPEVARLLRVRRPLGALHAGLSGNGVRLVREVNSVLRVLATPERHRLLLDNVLLPLLHDEHGPRALVPPAHQQWVHDRATRMRDELTAGGYPLHGAPDLLVPAVGRPVPDPQEGVLQVVVRTLLATEKETR